MNQRTFPIRIFLRIAFVCGLALLAGCHTKPATPPVPPEQAQYEQGTTLLRQGDIARAKGAFETAIRLNPGYAPAYLALADLSVRVGDISGAISQMDALQRAVPQTPHLYCRLAELHAASGRFLEGMMAVKLALDKEPDCPRAKMQYGLALVGTGDLKEATKYLQSAHDLQPDNPRITLELARLLARQSNGEAAWKLLDTLPTPSPLPVQENALRGWILAEDGRNGKRDDKAALALLDKALAQAPDDGPANLEKGRVLVRMGDAKGALTCLQKAASVSPPSVDLLSAMAAAGKQLKKPGADQMEQSARKFAAIVDDLYVARRRYLATPDNRDNQMHLARLEAAVGNGQDAQDLLTQILKKNPNDSEALQLLAVPEQKK